MEQQHDEELNQKIKLLQAKLEKVYIDPKELRELSIFAASKMLKDKKDILETLGE